MKRFFASVLSHINSNKLLRGTYTSISVCPTPPLAAINSPSLSTAGLDEDTDVNNDLSNSQISLSFPQFESISININEAPKMKNNNATKKQKNHRCFHADIFYLIVLFSFR